MFDRPDLGPLFAWTPPPPPPSDPDDATIDARFRAFHAANPQVYTELVKLARHGVAQGNDRLGIRNLWEVMRWNLTVVVRSADGFKLNDHYHSRYARLIMEREVGLAEVFELRRLRAA